MAKTLKRMSVLGVLLLSMMSEAFPGRVILVRHAEKPAFKSEDLSPKGFQRAQAMADLFLRHPELAQKGLPVLYLAAAYIPGQSSKRCVQTLTPLASKMHMPLQTPFATEDYQRLATSILNDRNLNGRTLMIAWTHTYINALASALGAPQTEPWPGEVFDRIWVLDYSPDGRLSFHDLPQGLLPGDSN